MSLIKGNLNSENEFNVIDSIRGVSITSPNTDPSFIALETGDGVKQYLWFDNSDNLRMWTTRPEAATHDSGNIIAGASNAGASKQLDNLGTTAVNADIILNDNVNLSVGASADMTFDYDGTDIEIAFAAANTVVNFGQTNPSDLILWGNAGTANVEWDASVDELILQDGAVLVFGGVRGTNDGIEMYFDGTSDFHIDAVAADDIINIGASVDTDIIIHGGTADSDVTWEADNDILYFADATYLGFGDSKDMYFDYAAGNTLSLLQTVALTGEFCLGVDDHGIDFTFFADASGNFMKWDASADLFIYEDTGLSILGANTDYQLAISTDALLLDEVNDHANGNLILGASGDNGLDVTFQGASSGDHVKFVATGTWTYTDVPVILTGADSSGTLLTITGIDTTGNTDTVLIDHSGDGYALSIDLNEATSDGIKIEPFTAGSVPALIVDAATTAWVGAADVGLIDVATSGVLAAGANLLRIDSSGANTAASFAVEIIVSGTVAGSTLGTALNITDTGAVAGTSYAAYINSTANAGLNIVTGAVDKENLVMTGLAAQARPMLYVDGTTGTGWDGANDVGMVQIETLIQEHTGATCLLVDTEVAPIAQAEGACARFIQSGGDAVTDAYLVQIEATTLGGALHVDSGFVTFDEALTVGGTLTQTGAATFTAGQQSSAVALTALVTNGVATPAGTTFVDVTSDSADKIVDLPTPVLGNVVYYMESTAVGYELAPQADTQYINNTLCGSAKELAIAAASLIVAVCVVGGAAGKWYVSYIGNDGAWNAGGTPN